MLSDFKAEIFEAAKSYIARGWLVFPLHSILENGECTCGDLNCEAKGKHPRVAKSFKEASADFAKIIEWFGDNAPLSNIGIATGAKSGLTVLDLDISDEKNGVETLRQICGKYGFPQTLKAQTGSGGVHLLFKYNSVLKNAADVFGSGVDVRNDGGYIVAAPSRHKSGGAYSWLNTDALADLPAYLTQFNKRTANNKAHAKTQKKAKWQIADAEKCLAKIDNSNYDVWRGVGIILGREFAQSDEAWNLYQAWSSRDYAQNEGDVQTMHEAFYVTSAADAEKELHFATLIKWADLGAEFNVKQKENADGVTFVDWREFAYFAPDNQFFMIATMQDYSATKGVEYMVGDKKLIEKITSFNRCSQKNRLPQFKEKILRNKRMNLHGEIIDAAGECILNTYLAPTIFDTAEYKSVEKEFEFNADGTIKKAPQTLGEHFLYHCQQLFNKAGDANQVLNYLALLVQKPWVKPRFALLIAGGQGIGKDTVIEMAEFILGGEHNVASIPASDVFSQFNDFAEKGLVRINEVAFTNDFQNKFNFENNLKNIIAGQPDTIIINSKYGKKYPHKLTCGVIITTNHLTSGVHISDDDRRYDVIDCAQMNELKNPFLNGEPSLANENGIVNDYVKDDYFKKLWRWFHQGIDGYGNRMAHAGKYYLACFLKHKDLSKFSADNGQRKTDAHKRVISVGLSGTAWVDDLIADLGYPKVLNVTLLYRIAINKLKKEERLVKAQFYSGLEKAGYRSLNNNARKDGRWSGIGFADWDGTYKTERVSVWHKGFVLKNDGTATAQIQAALDSVNYSYF